MSEIHMYKQNMVGIPIMKPDTYWLQAIPAGHSFPRAERNININVEWYNAIFVTWPLQG